jgi:hypothetical protein
VPPPPADQLWSSTLRGGTATGEALSPDGSKLFVLGYTGSEAKSETVAYDAATGARLWARTYLPDSGGTGDIIAVSPDGTRVYVTGYKIERGYFTIAYAAGTGRQLWVSPFISKNSGLSGLAVSPDDATVYEVGSGHVAGKGTYIAVAAYNAATGKQRWLRYYTKLAAGGARGAVAVSRDGSTVYVAGEAGSDLPSTYSLVVLAYRAAGTLKWAARYTSRYSGGRYAGGAFGGPILLGPGGSEFYVAGTVSSQEGHPVAATFAFRAATGKCLWLDPDSARGGGSKIAVTPDGRSVIFVGDRTGDTAGGYAIASYNASSGATRWATRAPVPGDAPIDSAGLIIDPAGDTAFVASPGAGYDLAAWSVADGTVRWTTSYSTATAYQPVAIVRNGNGTRLFVTGSVGFSGSGTTTTLAYLP